MKPAVAWTMADARNRTLLVHLFATDRYFAVGTEWIDTGDETKWYTRSFDTIEEAHEFAVDHTAILEKGGDEITRGPLMAQIGEHVFLDELVGKDVPSAQLAYIFDQVMDAGAAA